MTLNWWRPIFPAHLAEDNLVSPMRIVNGYLVEGIPERNGEGFGYDFRRDTSNDQDSSDSVYNELLDRLPPDPFEMDISTSITAAISGLFENLDAGYGNCGMSSYAGTSNRDYGVFPEFGVVWNTASSSRPTDNTLYLYQSSGDINYGSPNGIDSTCITTTVSRPDNKTSDMCCQGIPEETAGVSCHSTDSIDGAPHQASSFTDSIDGAPHQAFLFALGYLGVKDLLSVEMTSRSLCYTVRNDPLLWRTIHIGKTLNERITDDSLLLLASKSQGNLYCLSLLACTKITNEGLKRAVELNPKLNKLCVPGCTRLSIDGIVGIVKTINHTQGSPRIKFLRIGGIFGVTNEHWETLKGLLDVNQSSKQPQNRPHFYIREKMYLLCDDSRAIDVEECPRCQKFRLVYDCPFKGCQVKDGTSDSCRACALCILRCCQCGRCIDGIEYEENFWLELHCAGCK